MKRVYIILILAGLCNFRTRSFSQTIIPRIGISLATTSLDFDPIANFTTSDGPTKMVTGVVAGIAVDIPLSTRISLQPECSFVQKGMKLELSDSDPSSSFTRDLKSVTNFLEVPVLAKAWFGNNASLKFYASFGPSFGIGLGGHYKSEAYRISSSTGEVTWSSVEEGKMLFEDRPDGNYDDVYYGKKFEFGLNVGVGVLLKEIVLLEARYNYGLTDWKEYKHTVHSYSNRVLQFTVGVPLYSWKK